MDRRTHIPQHIESAMNQHMQRSMPAHLKKYMNSDRPTYVPQHAQKAMADYMQKSMPTHLKQYAGAYMQQRVAMPNTANPRAAGAMQGARLASRAPMPDKLRLEHSQPVGEQHNVQWNERPITQPAATPAPPTTAPPPENTPPAPPYDFIMNPNEPPPPSRLRLPGGNGAMKALFAAGGLLVLLMAFLGLRGLLGGGSNLDSFVTVAQDQQAIIHLTGQTSEQTNLSASALDFAVTANLTLISAQSDLIEYLGANGKKVNAKQLNLKVSAETDERLTTAQAAATYNQTYKEVLEDALNEYVTDLQQTYNQTSGKNGRDLLSKQYDQAQLLVKKLETVTN